MAQNSSQKFPDGPCVGSFDVALLRMATGYLLNTTFSWLYFLGFNITPTVPPPAKKAPAFEHDRSPSSTTSREGAIGSLGFRGGGLAISLVSMSFF